MPDGGSLSIETANVEITGSSGGDIAPGQYVVIDVRDTGCGIPKELLDKVFEPFFTTRKWAWARGWGCRWSTDSPSNRVDTSGWKAKSAPAAR